jgi:hypothetical protein
MGLQPRYLGRRDQTELLLIQAVHISKRMLGAQHPDTLLFQENLDALISCHSNPPLENDPSSVPETHHPMAYLRTLSTKAGTDYRHKYRCHGWVSDTGFPSTSLRARRTHWNPERRESTIQDRREATNSAPYSHPCALNTIEKLRV